ncbi:MAG TPA: metallophosphoesterase family protein [Candidatus Dormibacteraeota bacterium]|nr:metallophosphoesterase family protein [Candidatus Dormibacteraeota bacterium]
MRFLILSDIHANITALDAALAAVQDRWERVLCLGDIVDYGPDPNEVTSRVKALAPIIIRGNHDKAVAGLSSLDDFNPVAKISARWTREQLRPENLDYIAQLPAGPLSADSLTLVHGAYHDEDEYVFVPGQAMGGLVDSPSTVTFFGHTHYQGGFSYRAGQIGVIQLKPEPGSNFAALRLAPDTRYLLNPGSIGQPRDGDPRAALAIADLDHDVIEFWRVPYDIGAVQQRMRAAGLPASLIDRIGLGR